MAIKIPGSSGTDADGELGSFDISSPSTPIIPTSAATDADGFLGAFVPGGVISISEQLVGSATVSGSPVVTVQVATQLIGEAFVNASPTVVFVPVSCSKTFFQRILDMVAGWCYYSDSVSNPAPLPASTSPNHTGALVPTSHQIISEVVL